MKEKLLLAAAALLGFATACNNEEDQPKVVSMYGVPYNNYKIKDRVKTEGRHGIRSITAGPIVVRTVPANPTVRRRSSRSILSPRIPTTPVFDISIVLVQYPIPFVALGRAASGIARACTITSHGWCTQHIVHAVSGVVFAENQARIV